MSTYNIRITRNWTQITNFSDFFLLSLAENSSVEVAAADTSTPPVVDRGHVLDPTNNNGLTRDMIGPGYIFARAVSTDYQCVVVLSSWS
jgi:hypothetical protein